MASDAPGNSPHSHVMPVSASRVPSIAPSLRLTVALLSAFVMSSVGAQPLALQSAAAADIIPPLGNTPESDRLMLREISDQHVFVPTASATASATVSATASGLIDASYTSTARSSEDLLAPLDDNTSPSPARTVWQFVQQSRRLQIPDNQKIDNYRQQYQHEAVWISRILERATPFAGHIVEALDARYLPVELALLPAIESGYQPDVHSAQNAAGIWQIVPATARDIGVEHNQWFDGRADIVESTVAAIDYLSYLNAEFHGDWLLTLAAYNAGPGRVRNAIKRNRNRGLPEDFWSLSLPGETREYVPKFLALVAMLRHDSLPGFEIPVVDRGPGFQILDIGQRTSLDRVAAASGVPESELRKLNSALVHGVTPPQGPHHVYVLKDHAAQVIDAMSRLEASELLTLPATHTVVPGDSISSIARQYGLTQRRLMELNALESSVIRIGQELAVRYDADTMSDSIEYVVTIGDTLSDIARRFTVSLDRIRDADGKALDSDTIHPGERLLILLDVSVTG